MSSPMTIAEFDAWRKTWRAIPFNVVMWLATWRDPRRSITNALNRKRLAEIEAYMADRKLVVHKEGGGGMEGLLIGCVWELERIKTAGTVYVTPREELRAIILTAMKGCEKMRVPDVADRILDRLEGVA